MPFGSVQSYFHCKPCACVAEGQVRAFAYLMSCLRLSSRPRTTQRKCSTRSAGGSCRRSCSSSRGPKCASDLGITGSNRLRNMTMNCKVGELRLRQRDRAFSRSGPNPTRRAGHFTYCDVWIVCKNVFVRRRGFPLAWWRRHLFLPCLGHFVFGYLVEELQNAILWLQLNL